MSNVVISIRQRTRGNVTAPMVLWSLAMTVALFLYETRWSSTTLAVEIGVVATVAFGGYLGWRRRAAAVLVAPIVSWFLAWPALWVAAMIRHGFIKGLFVGLFLITIGWIAIGFAEFVGLGAAALAARWLHGSRGQDRDVVIFGPSDGPST
ncbi:MAG: hypothetical protein KGJ36_04285 [Acidobacteriota bacterium]|nr:hypothetical protein [Acidobacteriota bacterium]